MARTVTRTSKARATAPTTGADTTKMINAINKQYGDGLVVMGGQTQQPIRLPTGIFALDLATLGGIPSRGITMYHGMRSSGKTTSTFKAIGMFQRLYPEKDVAFVDAELTFDPVWAGKLGVDVDRLIIVRPETGEQAVDIIDGLMQTESMGLVVLDCVAALVPMKELDESAEDAHVGIHAKLVTRLCRKVNAAFAKARQSKRVLAFLCINQQRAGIGKWAPSGQEAVTLPGGKALDHYTLLQVKFKNKEKISRDAAGFETTQFNEHAFQIDKNKMNAGLRTGEFQLMRRYDEESGLNEGDIDDCPTMLAYAKKLGIYTGGGQAWTLDLNGRDLKFKSASEACAYFNDDFEEFWLLRNHLIALHARNLNMPESFIQRFYE